MQVEKYSLKELHQRYTMDEIFYFFSFKDGFMTYYIDRQPFTEYITFFPSPFFTLFNGITIDDLTAAIDTSRHYSLKIEL